MAQLFQHQLQPFEEVSLISPYVLFHLSTLVPCTLYSIAVLGSDVRSDVG